MIEEIAKGLAAYGPLGLIVAYWLVTDFRERQQRSKTQAEEAAARAKREEERVAREERRIVADEKMAAAMQSFAVGFTALETFIRAKLP